MTEKIISKSDFIYQSFPFFKGILSPRVSLNRHRIITALIAFLTLFHFAPNILIESSDQLIRETKNYLLEKKTSEIATDLALQIRNRLIKSGKIPHNEVIYGHNKNKPKNVSVKGYQLLHTDGKVIQNVSFGDFDTKINSKMLKIAAQEGQTIVQLPVSGKHKKNPEISLLIGEAYTPLRTATGKTAILRVKLDMSAYNKRLNILKTLISYLFFIFLHSPYVACILLLYRNILKVKFDEIFRKQQNSLLKELAKKRPIETLLRRIITFIEVHYPDSKSCILLIDKDKSGHKITQLIASDPDTERYFSNQPLFSVPKEWRDALLQSKPILRKRQQKKNLYSIALKDSSGIVLGSFNIIFQKKSKTEIFKASTEPAEALTRLTEYVIENNRMIECMTKTMQQSEVLLTSSVEGIIGLDRDENIRSINSSAINMFGIPENKMIGRNIKTLIHTKPEENFATLQRAIRKKIKSRINGIRLYGPEEIKEYYSDLIINPIHNPKTNLHSILIFHDINRQKKILKELQEDKEIAENENKAKSKLLAKINHEIRTPLNTIIGFAEIIHKQIMGPTNPETYNEYAEGIKISGQHLLKLTDELLDLSKIESGKMTLIETVIHIPSFLKNCQFLLGDGFFSRNIFFKITASDKIEYLLADETKLYQIIINLLSNAMKFTQEGGQILLLVKQTEGATFHFEISDTGIGFGKEENEECSREKKTMKKEVQDKNYASTGLGLPLSEAMVKLHGGNMIIKSIMHEGTTVIVRLPGRILKQKKENSKEERPEMSTIGSLIPPL
ncbi:MAG: PAS domain-containing sensor histidine kinase [Alphaproteobacteria bacterium]|nr:PAS domain-containing sensor histidine kinase [Alphaproteobacteria bacterium]